MRPCGTPGTAYRGDFLPGRNVLSFCRKHVLASRIIGKLSAQHMITHLARETWRTKVFADNGDIYCASASAMFGLTVEKHGQNSHLR